MPSAPCSTCCSRASIRRDAARTSPALLLKAIVDTDPKRLSDAATDADASARSATRESLRRQLRGDLDTIVAKALKKDPAERYASVDAMAADVRRYLGHEPIGARPDTIGYRTAKFVRRHRAGVAAGALAAAALVAGTLAIVWQAREVRKQRDDARSELARSTATNEFLGFLLSAAAPPGRKFVVADLLEQGEAVVDAEFSGDHPLHAELLATVGRQYVNGERWEKAIPVLERAAKIAARAGDPALRARAQCPLALAYVAVARRKDGEDLMARTLADLSNDPRYDLARAECLTHQSEFGYMTDDGDAMIRHATEALALLERAPLPTHQTLFDAQGALAYGYYLTRQNAEGRAGVRPPVEGDGSSRPGPDARSRGPAQQLGPRPLSRRHPKGRAALPPLAGAPPLDRGRGRAGRRHPPQLRRRPAPAGALPRGGVVLPADHPRGPGAQRPALRHRRHPRARRDCSRKRAGSTRPRRRWRRSTRTYGRKAIWQLSGAPTSPTRAECWRGRGVTPRERSTGSRRPSTLYDKSDAKFIYSVFALIGLAEAQLTMGQAAAAEATVRRALDMAASLVEKDSPSYLIGLSRATLGEAQAASGERDAARESLRIAVTQLEQTLGPDHPSSRRVRRFAEGL